MSKNEVIFENGDVWIIRRGGRSSHSSQKMKIFFHCSFFPNLLFREKGEYLIK